MAKKNSVTATLGDDCYEQLAVYAESKQLDMESAAARVIGSGLSRLNTLSKHAAKNRKEKKAATKKEKAAAPKAAKAKPAAKAAPAKKVAVKTAAKAAPAKKVATKTAAKPAVKANPAKDRKEMIVAAAKKVTVPAKPNGVAAKTTADIFEDAEASAEA